MNSPLVIDYYSDVLCVWAWIAQRRIDELKQSFGDDLEFRYRYVDIFGDTQAKMAGLWQQKGGYEGFAQHVQNSANDYEHAAINARIWTQVRPTTSANAHLILKAVELVYDRQTSIDCALMLREAFFVDAVDIGKLDVLYELLASKGLNPELLQSCINNGSAIAALMNDYQICKLQTIKGSPSYVIDGGRQVLYGNVGYRVLHANIEELAKNPQQEASWC
ncbi:MAG: DsbA family protein [Gammaproteobacteria bacterium]|nr:DsbA family protein [Gammaproteobacteria bacterium]MBQ0839247.1 DsbA family protein [Gammaproteobacteria bacterium]